MSELKPGEDYYIDELGRYVFTAKYHLKRGYCCQSGCRHCPYGFKRESVSSPKETKKDNGKKDSE